MKWLTVLALSSLTLGACSAADNAMEPATNATSDPGVAAVRKALLAYAPGLQIDTISPAPLPGFYQVIAAGQLAYVSADGKYMMHGNLVQLDQRKELSDDTWASFRKAELAKWPASTRIVFAPAHPKYRITVFTDVNCGYCRALHRQIADFNKAGIEVDYMAWPREGVVDTAGKDTPTYTEMVSVWCAADRKAAFTAAKQDNPPKPATCANPVKGEFALGERLGVNGTPTIIADDGSVVGGFVTPDKLLKILKNPSEYRMPEAN